MAQNGFHLPLLPKFQFALRHKLLHVEYRQFHRSFLPVLLQSRFLNVNGNIQGTTLRGFGLNAVPFVRAEFQPLR